MTDKHLIKEGVKINTPDVTACYRKLQQIPTALVTRVGKFHFICILPPPPLFNVDKHFDLTQVCILLFSNIERGNGVAGTYSAGITVGTPFVHGCTCSYLTCAN